MGTGHSTDDGCPRVGDLRYRFKNSYCRILAGLVNGAAKGELQRGTWIGRRSEFRQRLRERVNERRAWYRRIAFAKQFDHPLAHHKDVAGPRKNTGLKPLCEPQ